MSEAIVAVCSGGSTEHLNTLCEQNVEFLKVNPGGKNSCLDRRTAHLKGSMPPLSEGSCAPDLTSAPAAIIN
jgi:hypothetical protein